MHEFLNLHGILLHTEGLEFENLWLPFFRVSANLSRARMQVHDRGSADAGAAGVDAAENEVAALVRGGVAFDASRGVGEADLRAANAES